MPVISRNEHIHKLLISRGLHHGDIKTVPLEGGLWNDAVRVDTGERSFVFKTFSKVDKDAFFPNSATDEAEALRRLSEFDVSPKFVAMWPEENLLVYEYVTGSTWAGDVEAVAKLLKRKEAADPTGFSLGQFIPTELLAEGDAIFGKCHSSKPPLRPPPIDILPPDHLSLIHRDIGPNNLVGVGDGLRLIDWQCPTMGDLTEDIYSFLSPAFHIVSERDALTPLETARFFHALDLPSSKTRYEQLAPYFAWRMTAYCCWRSETHHDPSIRERYRRASAAEYASSYAQK